MAALCKICEDFFSRKQLDSDVNAHNIGLLIAAKRGHEECATLLLEMGADVNCTGDDETWDCLNYKNDRGRMLFTQEPHMALRSVNDNPYAQECHDLLDEYKEIYELSLLQNFKFTALMLASLNGHENCARLLLQKGADVNKANKYGLTALMCAARGGFVNLVEVMIQAGAHVNVLYEEDSTNKCLALICASKAGNVQCLDALILAGADVNTSFHGFTAIGCAAEKGNENFVEKLISKGANLNYLGINSETALMKASRYGLVNIVKMLLEAGADVKVVNMMGYSAVTLAASSEAEQCLKLLIEALVDVNDLKRHVTAGLMEAVIKRSKNCLKLLIEAGADVNWINILDGETLLMMSAKNGREECLKILIEAGAHVDQTDFEQKTALMHAIENKKEQCVTPLIAAGADVNFRNEEGQTAIEVAITEESEQCVELLLKAGADPNSKNSCQESLLSMAMQTTRPTCIKPVLDAGADVKTIENGIADLVLFGKLSDAEHLINAGVDVNGSNSENESVLLRGAMTENNKFVKLLLRASAYININNYVGHNALEEYIAQKGRVKRYMTDGEYPTSAKKRMCMLLFAAGELCRETAILLTDDEYNQRGMIKNPEYLLESEFSLKNKCREAVRNHLLDLDQHTNLFIRIPPSLQRYLLYGFSLDDDDDEALYSDEEESNESDEDYFNIDYDEFCYYEY